MSFLTFLVAATVLAVTPGPGIAYVVARTVAGGRPEGLASCVGTAAGGLVHVLAAAFGLSVLLAKPATAFSLVKYLGAAYLVYMGVRMLMRDAGAVAVKAVAARGARRALIEGVAVEVLNVKTALFFLAFLPQFVAAARGHVASQVAQLGALFTVAAVVVFGAIGYFAGGIGERLARRPAAGAWLDRAAGGIFVALGLRLLVARWLLAAQTGRTPGSPSSRSSAVAEIATSRCAASGLGAGRG